MSERVVALSAFQVSETQSFGQLCAFVDAPDMRVDLNLNADNAGTAAVSIMFLVNGDRQYQTQNVTGTAPVSVSPPDGTSYTEISNQNYTGTLSMLFIKLIQTT